jgi:hypothetical protein
MPQAWNDPELAQRNRSDHTNKEEYTFYADDAVRA